MERLDLLPCPFCGEIPQVVEDNSYGDCQIGCICPAEPFVTGKVGEGELESIIKIWNTRKERCACNGNKTVISDRTDP